MHRDIMNSTIYVEGSDDGYAYLSGINSAAMESEKVTEQVAIDFADWLAQNYFEQNQSEKWTSELIVFSGCIYTTKELFQEFIKTKQ